MQFHLSLLQNTIKQKLVF